MKPLMLIFSLIIGIVGAEGLGKCEDILKSISERDSESFLSLVDSCAIDYYSSSTAQEIDSIIRLNVGNDYKYSLSQKIQLQDEQMGGERISSVRYTYQVVGDSTFGFIKLRIHANSGKLIGFGFDEKLRKKPNILMYWFVFLIGFTVFLVNIYAIIRIFKSKIRKRNLLFPLLLNVFPIRYLAIGSITFNFLSINFLGFGFRYLDFLNTSVTIAIPVGAIIVLRKIRKLEDTQKNLSETPNEVDNI